MTKMRYMGFCDDGLEDGKAYEVALSNSRYVELINEYGEAVKKKEVIHEKG